MEDLKINITANGNELVIREGAALPLHDKKSVSLLGTIESVLDFADKRKSEITPLKTHVVINRKAGSIMLVVFEDDDINYKVSGQMILHEYIQELGINTPKTWTIHHLINLFKISRRFFESRDAHATMVGALTNFQAKTETEFASANDFKGSVANKKITSVKHSIPLDFAMNIPVFEGQEKKKFNVTIEVLPQDGSLICQFISVSLAELIDENKEEVFNKVKKELSEYVQIVQ